MAEILDITLEYTLLQLDEKSVDAIVARELNHAEKRSILLQMNETQKRSILLKMGYTQGFIDTL